MFTTVLRQPPGHPWKPPQWELLLPSMVVINVIIISLCDGTSIPLLAFKLATEELETFNIRVVVIDTYVFENNATVRELAASLREHINWPGTVTIFDDIATFPDLAASLSPPTGALIVVMAGTPCTAISRGARRATRKFNFGLHAPPSNLWWLAHKGIHTIAHRFKFRFVSFVENVIPGSQVDLTELDATAGVRHTMSQHLSQPGTRDRYVWTSMAFSTPQDINDYSPWYKFPDDFTMDFDSHSRRKYPTLRAIIPDKLFTLATQPSRLDHDEPSMLQKFFIHHVPTRQKILPPIEVLVAIMGLPPSTAVAFRKAAPCTGLVTFINPAAQARTTPCGQHFWCGPCSDIVKALGNAWHGVTAAAHLRQLLATHIYFIDTYDVSDTKDLLTKETFPFHHFPHICPAQCIHNRSVL